MNFEVKDLLELFSNDDVFVVGPDGDISTGEVAICDSMSELNELLSTMDASHGEEAPIVLHGILTSAKYIPDDAGRNVFFLITNPKDVEEGCIIEARSSSPNGIARHIEEIIENGILDEIEPTIDSIFIVYAYDMRVCFSVSEDDVDEQILEDCKKKSSEANEIRKNIMEMREKDVE